MRRPNPQTNQPFKYGDTREKDKYRFEKYKLSRPVKKNGYYQEGWLSPESFKHLKESNKKYRIKNREKIREKNKNYRINNPEKSRESSKTWAENNKDKIAAKNAKQKAIERSPKNQKWYRLFKKEIDAVYTERENTTAETGIEHHVDHIRPKCKGGEHNISNLQVLTAKENLQKNSKWEEPKEPCCVLLRLQQLRKE